MKIITAVNDSGVMSPQTPIPETYFSVCYNGGLDGYPNGAFIVYESEDEVPQPEPDPRLDAPA